MKRFFCMLLVAAMLLSFVPAVSMQAAAAGVTTAVEITIAPLTPGAAVPAVPDVTANEGGTLAEVCWGVPGEVPTTDTVFLKGNRYYMTVRLTAPEGTVYEENALNIQINGEWRSYGTSVEDDCTVVELGIEVESCWQWVEEIELTDLPEEIAVGSAQIPEVGVVAGEATVAKVQWVNAEKQPVTTFQDGKVYLLEITLKPDAGYEINNWTGICFNGGLWMEQSFQADGGSTLYVRYSLMSSIGEVLVAASKAAEGMSVSDLTATVTGDATLGYIRVYDEGNNYLEEGTFQPLSNYRIEYMLEANAGYEFSYETSSLELNGGEAVEWSLDTERLYFTVYFSTCEEIEVVEMTLSEVTPGMQVGDVTLTVPADADYVLEEYYFEDEDWNELDPETTFQMGQSYRLRYQLTPKEGYVFSENVEGYINGDYAYLWTYESRTCSNGSLEISFTVDEIRLTGMPVEIEGGAAELPEIRETEEQVNITDVKWVNAEKQTVTSFEDGNVYYLAVEVEAAGTRMFNGEPNVETGYYGMEAEFAASSDTEGVIYIRYSLEPGAGDISITVTGLEEGKNIEDVVATVTGNATLQDIVIAKSVYYAEEDWYGYEQIEEGVFEANTNYRITYVLAPKAGYRFAGGFGLTVNGKPGYDCSNSDMVLEASSYFSTCEEIAAVKLTVSKVAVGKKFSDLEVTAPKNANYTVNATWVDITDEWQEASGKVQKGRKYQLYIDLEAKDGYVLSQELTATLNGDAMAFSVAENGKTAWGEKTYSFLEKITKVELPAMPKSISKGQTLPTDFAVASSKNYTLSATWAMMNDGEKTVADEDGLYGLVFNVRAKDGYEFSEDTKVYVGGKLFTNKTFMYQYESRLQVAKLYNVGLQEISKVELTVPELEEGQPPVITIPQDANYVVAESAWAQSENSQLDYEDENYDVVEQLQKGRYTYMGVLLAPAEGCVFAETVDFYINGRKVTPALEQNYWIQNVVFLAMGKLGEIEKLIAPTVTKEGETLIWNAPVNADSYEIYRATSKSGKYTKVATVAETTWTDSVAAGKTYYYKIKAIYTADTSKNSGYSGVVSIAYKCDAPVITVKNGDSGKPVISWEKVSGAKKYTVYRATAVDGKYTKLGTTANLSYTDTKAAVGATYFYKIIANASSSTYSSGYSNTVSCLTVCATPAVTIKIDAATGKPALSWSKVTGAVNYEVYLLGAEDYVVLGTVTGTSFRDGSCYAGEGRYYGVRAIAAEETCNSEVSEPVFGRGTCAQPKVTGSVNSDGKPVLTWEAVEGAAQYELYRSTKATKSYSLLATLETPSYVDESVAGGKTYYYKVVAIGENNKSAESSYVKLTGKCAAPIISVENGSSGKPVVSWEKVSGAKKYTVYRATAVDGKYKKLGTTKSLSYTDSKATAGSEYFYKVVANGSKKAYDSIYSNICSSYVICGTPSVTIKVDTATGKPSLSWGKITGAVKYRIFRQLPGEETFTVIAEQTAVTFKDETAPIDTVCNYRVQALGDHEMLHGAYSKIVTATSGIAQPKLNSGINSEGQPRFDWQQVEGAVKYEIYRSTKATKSYTLLATVEDGNAYADASAAPGKTYYYKVKAVGQVSSSESAYVKLTGKCAAPWISIALHETSGKPVISWEKVNGAKQYTVYRATSLEGKYTKLGTTKTLSYTDSKAVPGTEYYYKVIANGSKSSCNSNYSNVKFAVGYAAQPQVTLKNDSKGKPVVSWKKISEAERYIVVYVDITDVESESELTEQFVLDNLQYVEVSKKKTSTTLSQTQTGRIYMVCVVAMPKNEEFFAISQPGYVAAICAAPKISGKHLQGYNCGTWKAVEGAEYYAIYRSTKASGGYELIGYIDNDSSFVDLSAVKGKTYYYKVTACTEYTESEFSNYIKLKTK